MVQGKLRHAVVLLGQGKKDAEVVGALGITEVTCCRRRQEYRRMTTSLAKHLKELERENGQLRKTVADLTLDTLIFQDAAKGNF